MSYLRKLLDLDDRAEIVARCQPVIERLAPSALVGTGVSGTLAVSLLAHATGVPPVIVRKSNDGSHSGCTLEHGLDKPWPTYFERWLFVDDFVASGATLTRAYREVARCCKPYGSRCLGALTTIGDHAGRIDEVIVDGKTIPIYVDHALGEHELKRRRKAREDRLKATLSRQYIDARDELYAIEIDEHSQWPTGHCEYDFITPIMVSTNPYIDKKPTLLDICAKECL